MIYISGHIGAVPVYIRNKAGQVIGLLTSKIWPIPIVASGNEYSFGTAYRILYKYAGLVAFD